mgnify:CR=1 FL=1|jgi:hypothetical protein
MKLLPIARPFNKSTIWINPNLVISVVECNIGHRNQGVFGTSILVQGLNAIETEESIESVVGRIENESN